MMVQENESRFSTAFTVSIEAARGVTTGISAADRAATVLAAIAPRAVPGDLVRPGHVFPLRAREGGVLVRAGQTEGSVDLARLAGLTPAGVICEVMNDDGTMARLPDLEKFSAKHGLMILSVADIIQYRMQRERLVRRAAEAPLPTVRGDMRAIAYESDLDNARHFALTRGQWAPDEPVLVRVHSRCLTGDVFASARCDCGAQLQRALEMINAAGKGVLVYLDPQRRGVGLVNQLHACTLQDLGTDTVEASLTHGLKADLRDSAIGAQILRDLGVRKMRLMTNDPDTLIGLGGYGLEVIALVPLETPPTGRNADSMRVDRDELGRPLPLASDKQERLNRPAMRIQSARSAPAPH